MPTGAIDRTAPSLRGPREDAGVRLWWRAGADSAWEGPPRPLLDAIFARGTGPWLRRIPGRETFVWSPAGAGGEPQVVKRFRGDQGREVWYERLRGRAPRSPARRELENLAELARAGLRVPAPVACLEERDPRRAGARSAVAMERIANAEDLRGRLARRLADGLAVERELRALVELVVGLHRAGWYHRDLYLHQVLWPSDDGSPWLIDVGRARREARPRERWFVKDLAALTVSAPPGMAPLLGELLDAYLAGRAIGGAQVRRRWHHRVERKARRIAAHPPRWTDPDEEGS